MRRKVSLWIVILLVAALAATTTATVVLATDDRDGREVADEALPTGPHGQWQMAVRLSASPAGTRPSRRGPPLVPVRGEATGAAVGMLIAWSPCAHQPGDARWQRWSDRRRRRRCGDIAAHGGGIAEAAPT